MPTGESQTLLRAISIVDCFSHERPELGVREIARRLNLASSTVGRLLGTLQKAGLVTQSPQMRKYMLGPRVLTWAGRYTGFEGMRAVALPILDGLRQATRELTTLYVVDGDERVCVERLEGPQNIRAVVGLGERLPLYAGAGGKVLLAFLPPERRRATLARLVLARYTDKTIRNRARLERELQAIRRQGYATSVAERFAGATAVAAPVRGADGGVIAAINVSGPSDRFRGPRQARCVRLVTRAALALSRAMGGGGARP